MYSTKRIEKMMDKLKTLEVENELLAAANIELEKKLAGNTAKIISIKDDLSIIISEPIIKK